MTKRLKEKKIFFFNDLEVRFIVFSRFSRYLLGNFKNYLPVSVSNFTIKGKTVQN